jgi:hypothetical protein
LGVPESGFKFIEGSVTHLCQSHGTIPQATEADGGIEEEVGGCSEQRYTVRSEESPCGAMTHEV